MTSKRLQGETSEEVPLKKRERSEETNVDDLDAELDEEVEKELREFERLQDGLLGITLEQQNGETGAGKGSSSVESGSLEPNDGSGSDMEVDNDLEQEIAEAKERNTTMPHQEIDRASYKRPFLDGTDRSRDILVLPDTFAEENLHGNDMLEKSATPGDREVACLNIEQVRLYKDSPSIDPLNPECIDLNSTKPSNQAKIRPEPSEAEASPPENWSMGQENFIKSQSRKRRSKEEEDDPDFPSPSKRKSRSRGSTIPPTSSRYEPKLSLASNHRVEKGLPSPKSSGTESDGVQDPPSQNYYEPSEHPLPFSTRVQLSSTKTQQLENKHPRMVQSPVTKILFEDPVIRRPLQTTAQSESEISPSLPGTSKIGDDPFHAAPFVPKEAFVDPVLKIPVHQKTAAFDPKEAFEDPVLKMPVQPKLLPRQNPSFTDPILDNPKPSCSKAHQALPETLESREDLIPKRVIRIELAEEKMEELIPKPKEQHVKTINFDQPTTLSNPQKEQSPSISRLESPKSPVTPKEANSLIAPSPRPNFPKPPKHPAYMDFLKNSKSLLNHSPCPGQQAVKEISLQNQSDNSQPTEVTIDITADPPVDYCAIERVIQRRFKNSVLLDDEKCDLMEGGRPEIWCPELHPYMPFYDNQTWLAACNELKRFFCWPCLFFASKVIWSVTCDDHSEAILGKELNKHEQSPVHRESIKQRDAWLLKKKSSIIKALLNNNFVDGTWTDENQEVIIMKGRPCPILDNRTNKKSKTAKKTAFEEFYDQLIWICGCNSSEKFYCWPCVLFSGTGASAEKWTYAGTIESAEAAVLQHEMSLKHMDACLKLGKWELDLKRKSEAKKEEIEKTCDFLKCLVEVLCAEKKKINNSGFTAIDYIDSLELMSAYNKKLKTFMDEKSRNPKITVVKTVALHTTAILDSVEYFIKCGILEEIKNSNCISLIFDHSSGLSHKAILSVIARYVDRNGDVHERFVKLLNVGYNTPSNTLYDEFFQIIAELQCRSTLVSFTYDGYLVKPANMPEFNAKVQKLCPDAKFFHYREHNFKRVLKQALSHVPVCRSILQVVKELANFFESTPGARKGLSDIVTSNEKSECDDFWRSSDFIRIVFTYHSVIVEILEKISKNARDWKVKIVVQVTNFLDFFKEAKNRFFITLIARLYNAVEHLTKALDQDVGNEDLKTIASHTSFKIQKLGRNFDNVLDSACSHLEGRDKEKTRREMTNLREQFFTVVRLAVRLIKNRIIELETGYFKISKEWPTSSSTFSVKLKRQNLVLQNVALPSNFSSSKLSNELQFFHNASVFSDLDLSEIIAHMNKYNMIKVLFEFFKFLQLALTVPKKLYDSTIPAVHRITAYIEGKRDLNSTDALIWMEKEFLTNLQKEANFYEKVTDRVLAITKNDSFVLSNSKM